MDLTGNQGELLLRLMSASSLRARVLAANVANQNTPGYRRQEVRFEEELVRALERGNARLDRIEPEVTEDLDAAPRADGNSVDMEREVSALRENRLLYELYANILTGRTRLMQLALRGDR